MGSRVTHAVAQGLCPGSPSEPLSLELRRIRTVVDVRYQVRLRLVALLVTLSDDGVQQVDDLLLAGGSGVEFAAHLGEPVLYPVAEVGEVLAGRVEAGRGGLAEVPDLAANLANVAVGPAGQHASGCRVLLAVADAISELPDLGFQRGHTRFQVIRLSHVNSVPGARANLDQPTRDRSIVARERHIGAPVAPCRIEQFCGIRQSVSGLSQSIQSGTPSWDIMRRPALVRGYSMGFGTSPSEVGSGPAEA